MIILRVITCLIFLFLFSICKVKCISLNLGKAVNLSWDLRKGEGEDLSLTIRIALPRSFHWLVIGFDNTQTAKMSYEDLALVTIEPEGTQEVSYLKTVDLDEAYKLVDSQHELYDWGEHGRKKSHGTYHFKLERPVQYLKTCESVNLVWAYGIDLWRDKDVLNDRFHFKTIVLDKYKQFPCSYRKNENLENEKVVEPDVNYNGKVESMLNSDKNKDIATVINPSEFPQPTTTVMFTPESKLGTSPDTTKVNTPTDAILNNTALINQKNETKLDADRLSTELKQDPNKQDGILEVTTKERIPSAKSTFPTLLVKNQTIKPTLLPTSAIVLDITPSMNIIEVVTSEEINQINKNHQYVNQSFKEAIKTLAKGNEKNVSSCHLNPCLHSRCPVNTKCIANFLYCTSSCEKINVTSNKDTKSHCICVSGSHWYDFFKDNENSVYFAVIGLSAFFTGMIVLCLACCCGHKAKMKYAPNMRKSKVSFYKVDDFESSADEEVEFLAEGKKPFVD